MKTFDGLKAQWENCAGTGQVLVDHTHPLRLFLNINEHGNKEFVVTVLRPEKRFDSTMVIRVNNYEGTDSLFFAMELLDESFENEYYHLCLDLIESSRNFSNETEARDALFETFKRWHELLATKKRGILPEEDVRGLIGEIQYMIDEIKTSKRTDITVIDAWKIHKDSSRDFVYDVDWSEIKTVQSSKEYVTISSIEQLDSNTPGKLIVYTLDSSDDENSFSLNSKVDEIKKLLGFQAEIELNKKLISKGYKKSEEYDNWKFAIKQKRTYLVDDTFPKIKRNMLSDAVIRAKYDLRIEELEGWIVDD